MASILYSGNADKPNTFSASNMDNVTQTYNSVVDAIDFILSYTGRTSQQAVRRELEYSGLTSLTHIDTNPHDDLVSAVGMAADLHKQMALRKTDPFTKLATEKILNAVSNYESKYSMRCYNVSVLCWSFQTDMLLAFDKLYNEIKKFQAKYKNVPNFHKQMAEVNKLLRSTLDIIGAPENQLFTGTTPISKIFAIRDKLSANNTPIFPLHMYRDIMRFQEVKESVLATKREHSRKKHYEQMSRELNTIDDRNFELAQSNHELAQRVAMLERENAQLRAANTKLTSENTKLNAQNGEFGRQLDSFKRGIIGKILYNRAQKRK